MNPFILSVYKSPEYFCNREKELENLLLAIQNNRHTAIISRRRMGKTGLLMHLRYKLQSIRGIVFLYFDIMTTSSLNEFVNLFANSIFASSESKAATLFRTFSKVLAAFKPSFSVNSITGEIKLNLELSSVQDTENSLSTLFKHISGSKKQFVIVIDEFQQIVNYPEKNVEALLRSHIQHLNNATFIFSGSSKEILRAMFTNKKRPFYISSEIMYLDSINNKDYSKFIKFKFNLVNKKIENDVIAYILNLMNTHTYYVQLLCNRLYSDNLSEITIDDVNKTFKQLLDENRFYFESLKNLVTEYQWKLLQAIAKDKVVNEITSQDFIRRHNLGSSSSVSTAVKSLEKKEIIVKEKDGYKIDDLLFSVWLASI